MQVRVLTKSDLERVLTIRDAIEAVEESFRYFSLGKTIMPLRQRLKIEERKGIALLMPVYISPMNALGLKFAAVYSENPKEHNLPRIFSVVILCDAETGKPLSIIDGGLITVMRTGAVGALATKYLARKDAKTAGIIGLGTQGRIQLTALCEVRDIEKVKAYDVIHSARTKFAEEMSKKLGLDIIATDSSKDVVTGMDIITTCSTSTEPVFNGNWIGEGVHINSIGSWSPDSRELDTTTVKRSKVVVDSREACLAEAGDLIFPITEGAITKDHIYAELGEIILGTKPGRISDNEITLFKSVGLAIQDISTAFRAYEFATQKGVGQILEI